VTLPEYLSAHPNPEAMNLLQQNGIVSDNCIEPEDVAQQDHAKAIAFLSGLAGETPELL
jgi:hypothetical protein